MQAEQKFVPIKHSWMRAIYVIDPADRRLAANDNFSKAMRGLRLNRRLRALQSFAWALVCLLPRWLSWPRR